MTCTDIGLALSSGDCNDEDINVHPGGSESPADTIDSDCDGTELCFVDNDEDTIGSTTTATSSDFSCQSIGLSLLNSDCDDDNGNISPEINEIGCDSIDNDCDPSTPDTGDNDGDGFDVCNDCDDSAFNIHPGAIESCNGVDDDCDDEIDIDAVDASSWYLDDDNDGFGIGLPTIACAAPIDHVAIDGDCDDTEPLVNPGAPERCDAAEADDDCDGSIDDYETINWYADEDSDGYGDEAQSTLTCDPSPGLVYEGGDCDDGNINIHPGAPDDCDGIDNDCNNLTDDGPFGTTWYADADSDNYGDPATSQISCVSPDGWVEAPNDCDDNASSTYPGAPELCDNADNDCDGVSDNGLDTQPIWPDSDSDGYGDNSVPAAQGCDSLDMAINSDDCDDTSAAIFPGAPEICDTLDNDCDGAVDLGCDPVEKREPTSFVGCSCAHGGVSLPGLYLFACLSLALAKRSS